MASSPRLRVTGVLVHLSVSIVYSQLFSDSDVCVSTVVFLATFGHVPFVFGNVKVGPTNNYPDHFSFLYVAWMARPLNPVIAYLLMSCLPLSHYMNSGMLALC